VAHGGDIVSSSVGELIGRCLNALGVTRVFGSARSGVGGIPGLPHALVEEPALAVLLADAAGRIGPGPGVALLPGRVLRLGARPGASPERVVIDDVELVPSAFAGWSLSEVPSTVEYELALDLDAPAPDHLAPIDPTPELRASTLAPDLAEVRTLVLAGPGVVRHDAIGTLHEVARKLGAGVVNTWGAKGVYRWDDPHHFGTAGLQARDAELAGLTTAELVITTGLDPDEMPAHAWATGPVLDVDPRVLGALTYRWVDAERELARPALYEQLSSALGPLYVSDAAPLTPARAAADLGALRPAGGLVAADPGPVGLWVARALPTTEPASVIVPSLAVEGFALAAAVVASFEARPALAVVADPVGPATAQLLALVEHWGSDVVLEVWADDAAPRSPDDRAAELRAALERGGVSTVVTAIDLALTQVLIDVAGPVIAW
jgi:hypothetical protein